MCCVVDCTNTYSKNKCIKLFRFPSKPHDIEQRKKWIHAVKRKKQVFKYCFLNFYTV